MRNIMSKKFDQSIQTQLGFAKAFHARTNSEYFQNLIFFRHIFWHIFTYITIINTYFPYS
jgi:hypothetical protein